MGCPVDKDNVSKNFQGSHGCPLINGDDNIDLRNAMPPPNQRPAPDQPFHLSTSREMSNIPKSQPANGGKVETWEYPSPQMFWNAMLRKGWRWQEDQLGQNDMENIIKIHNSNNEFAWREVLKWERALHPECQTPALKSFHGDAKNYSIRARVRSWLGYELPFDRHNWVVDRCGQNEVTYIIDYYDVGAVNPETRLFAHLDVRPQIRDFGTLWDRMVVGYMRMKANACEAICHAAKSIQEFGGTKSSQ